MDQEERARRGGQAFFMAYVKGRGGRCGGEGVCVRGRRREENLSIEFHVESSSLFHLLFPNKN